MSSPLVRVLAGLEGFARQVQIPSRDEGLRPLWPLMGTQTYAIQEIGRALEDGVHDIVALKGGRQIGGTTILETIVLLLLQSIDGMIGMFVADSEDNRNYRRDLHSEMLASLPQAYRQPSRVDNANIRAWGENPATGYRGSRLIYAYAGSQKGSNLGRSRGVSLLLADEFFGWQDDHVITALRASLSKRNPQRLYLWNGTARGFGPTKARWDVATTAITQRAVFLAWYRHAGYSIARDEKQLWKRYGTAPRSEDERIWTNTVKKRYGLTITPEQIAWWRWVLAEECAGDEGMRAQEFGVLPEECFVAFGDHFIAANVIRRLRTGLGEAPKPKGYRYTFGDHLEDTEALACHPSDGQLVVWEEAERGAAYLVAAHPAYSSSERAVNFSAQVWRLWPDHMRQVAEYWSPDGEFHKFAWVLIHLAGYYSSVSGMSAYLIGEAGYTGQRVLGEIQRLERHGYGLGPDIRSQQFRNVAGNIRHYLYRRLDSLRSSARAWWPRTTKELRASYLNGLRDEVERRHVEIRSAALVDELAMLRRGEEGDRDMIAGGGDATEERALTAAHAVECWLTTAMPELVSYVAPKEPPPEAPRHPSEEMLAQFFAARMGR